MPKNTRQHIVYVILLILAFSAALVYNTTKLDNVQETLQAEIVNLKGEIAMLKTSLSDINSSLQEKENRIKVLGNELQKIKVENKAQIEDLQSRITSLKLQNRDFSEVIDEVIPTVVSIRTDVGSGSGFIIDQEGYVVTNYHVVQGARAATIVTSDGADHAVRVVGFDRIADVAVLELDGAGFSTISFADSNKVMVGERVIAIGNPGGLDFTVTQGIVSAVGREDSAGNDYIQIDVAINPGNSGGPLVNAEGMVIGINTKKIKGFEGVGFAIASNQAQNIAEEIMTEDRNS